VPDTLHILIFPFYLIIFGPGQSFDGEWLSTGSAKLEGESEVAANTSAHVEILSDGKVTGTLKLKDLFPRGLLKTKLSTSNKFFLGLEYSHDVGTFTAEGDHDLGKGATDLTVSSLLKPIRNVQVGGQLQLAIDGANANVNRYEIGLGYAQPSKKFELTAHFSEEVKKGAAPQLALQYIHFIDSIWTYGAKFTRPITDGKSTVELGGTYQLSGSSKVGAKVNHSGLVALYLLTRPDANVQFTQSLQFDATDAAAPHKFGMGIRFSK
jgi:hypothetical protein